METTEGIAIITGASSGIGAAFARRLAAAHSGAERYRGLPRFDRLWLVARRKDRLEALASELRESAPGLAIESLEADITAPGALEALAAKASGERPSAAAPVALLVNNAGYGSYGDFSYVSLERQLGQVDLNCRALAESCWRFSPLLGEGSAVINVASLAAFAPLGSFAVYAATKAFALSLSVAVGAEWKGRGIKVCALCPGPVDSEFARVASAGARETVLHGWSADGTAARCLRDAGAGRAISMPRLGWRLSRLAGSIVGPVASARLTYAFMKRPNGEARGSR